MSGKSSEADTSQPIEKVDGAVADQGDTSIEIEKVEAEHLPEDKTAAEQPPTHQVPTAQQLEARKIVIRQALNLLNVGLVFGVGKATKGLVTTEAALSPVEVETLATVWAPFMPDTKPIMAAAIATAGIAGGKLIAIQSLYKERKDAKDHESERQSSAIAATIPQGSSPGRSTGTGPTEVHSSTARPDQPTINDVAGPGTTATSDSPSPSLESGIKPTI